MAKKRLSKKFVKHLADVEARMVADLSALRATRRRAHGGKAPKVAAAAAPANATLSAASQKRIKIYQQLLGLFASDGKPVSEVRPQTVLGQYPLGYDKQGLSDFYTYKVNPWFQCTVTYGKVDNTKTVWDLVVEIESAGGTPR